MNCESGHSRPGGGNARLITDTAGLQWRERIANCPIGQMMLFAHKARLCQDGGVT